MPQGRFACSWCRGPARLRREGGRLLRLWRDEGGGALIEFALIAPMFFALILAILNISLIFLTQAGLETAAEQAARLLMTGQIQTWGYAPSGSSYTSYNGGSGMTAANFKAAICGQLGASSLPSGADPNNTPTYAASMMLPYMNCNNLYIDLETVSSFSAATNLSTITTNSDGTVNSSALKYSLGSQGSIEVLRLIYVWPTSPGPLGVNFASSSGSSNRLILATSILTTEGYTEPTT